MTTPSSHYVTADQKYKVSKRNGQIINVIIECCLRNGRSYTSCPGHGWLNCAIMRSGRRITAVITPAQAITVVGLRCNYHDNSLAGRCLPALIHFLDHLAVGAHKGLDAFVL